MTLTEAFTLIGIGYTLFHALPRIVRGLTLPRATPVAHDQHGAAGQFARTAIQGAGKCLRRVREHVARAIGLAEKLIARLRRPRSPRTAQSQLQFAPNPDSVRFAWDWPQKGGR